PRTALARRLDRRRDSKTQLTRHLEISFQRGPGFHIQDVGAWLQAGERDPSVVAVRSPPSLLATWLGLLFFLEHDVVSVGAHRCDDNDFRRSTSTTVVVHLREHAEFVVLRKGPQRARRRRQKGLCLLVYLGCDDPGACNRHEEEAAHAEGKA